MYTDSLKAYEFIQLDLDFIVSPFMWFVLIGSEDSIHEYINTVLSRSFLSEECDIIGWKGESSFIRLLVNNSYCNYDYDIFCSATERLTSGMVNGSNNLLIRSVSEAALWGVRLMEWK